jgi:hypothetical protein
VDRLLSILARKERDRHKSLFPPEVELPEAPD